MRNDNTRERLENITERNRKARLMWVGNVKRPIISRKKDSGDRTTGQTTKRKAKAEMGGRCQPRYSV